MLGAQLIIDTALLHPALLQEDFLQFQAKRPRGVHAASAGLVTVEDLLDGIQRFRSLAPTAT